MSFLNLSVFSQMDGTAVKSASDKHCRNTFCDVTNCRCHMYFEEISELWNSIANVLLTGLVVIFTVQMIFYFIN